MFDIHGVNEFLIIMGAMTMIIAEVSALRQTNLKRMLAYSSIGQMGFVLIAFGIGTNEAVFGALFLMLNHAVIKGLLFMSGSYLVYNTPSKEIKDMSGIGHKLPMVSLFFALGALAIVGLPPFAGFWSKLYILMATADSGLYALMATILAVSIIELVYYLRVLGRLYFGKPQNNVILQKPTFGGILSMTVLGIAIVAIGFHPDLVSSFIHNAADTLLDRAGYIHNILPDIDLTNL
jgi:formate hydrogenlyase subunit 3/multisubunit Na+/H+ antiporter MnhD subunit